MEYTLTEWLLIFFIYCFLGWIWECCFVAYDRREWINRGFLFGPMLPIYGSGAFITLWLTLPVQDNLFLVYIIGVLGASVLEYFVGMTMERIFKMRYWDYTEYKFNLNGYISLFVSLAWGFFALFLVKILHPPIGRFVIALPDQLVEILSLGLLAIFVVDMTKSVQAAIDVRNFLQELAEESKVLAAVEGKVHDITAELSLLSEDFQKYVQELRAGLKESAEGYQITGLSNKLSELRVGLDKIVERRANRSEKEYRLTQRIIRKYPSTVSKNFKEALDEIKAHSEGRKK